MGFVDMLVDIAKTLGALAVSLITGVRGLDGIFVGELGIVNYVLLGVSLISMLFLFYMIQRMQATTY